MAEFVTVHLLDWVYGRPAAGVPVRLHRRGESHTVAAAETDDAGSCRLALAGNRSADGYRLILNVDPYFAGLGIEAACPEVTVACRYGGTVVVHVAPFGHAVYIGQ